MTWTAEAILTGPLLGAWAANTDRRVKYISSVLRHIKSIKLSAYEPIIQNRAVELRHDEINTYIVWVKSILRVSIITNWLGNFLALITVITFTVVSLFSSSGGGAVTTAKVFTVVSTISLLSSPLLMLGQQLGAIVSAWASVKRIEEFLLQEERVEFGEGLERDDIKSDVLEQKIQIKNASFGVKDKITILSDMNVDLVKPSLWMIIGRVGCVSLRDSGQTELID
jgi:ATP-binding cassette subfamily C (CFTR/MRP) protein 1